MITSPHRALALAAALLLAALPLRAEDFAPASVAFRDFAYAGHDDVFAALAPDGQLRNPILAGYFPDPSICRVGDDYYIVNSTFAYFPGIPISHSRDLVHWRQIGHVIDRPEQLNFDRLGVTRGLFAPALSWHDGTFYLTCTMVDGGGNFLVTARNPAGPWSDPQWLDFEGIDPSLFFDADGRAWMLNNGAPDGPPLYPGHRAIWIQEFDLAAQKLVGPRRVLVNGGVDLAQKPVWIEGPHLYRRDGWYYLCCAEGGTSLQHSQVILRSRSVTGPFVPWEKNPILTQRDLDPAAPHAVTCTGHADLFVGPDGRWWSVFLGCRPFAGGNWFTGRETFLLPVTWTDDGWPVILPRGERVPALIPAPAVPSSVTHAPLPSLPTTGNFSVVEKFDRAALPLHWFMLRAPHSVWWQTGDGALRLTPLAATLADRDAQPAFLARRVQHANFDASVTLDIPTAPGVTAGLVAFQSETQHFFFGVRRSGEGLIVFLERRHAGKTDSLAQATAPATPQLTLSLSAREQTLAFSFSVPGGAARTLADKVDSYPLTVQAAGGGLHFTGAVLGIHARREP